MTDFDRDLCEVIARWEPRLGDVQIAMKLRDLGDRLEGLDPAVSAADVIVARAGERITHRSAAVIVTALEVIGAAEPFYRRVAASGPRLLDLYGHLERQHALDLRGAVWRLKSALAGRG